MARRLIAAVVASALAAAISIGQDKPSARAPYPTTLPEGEGRELVRQNCLVCHSAMLITQQRKSPEGWEKSVGTMIDWGTRIRRSDREVLLEYLKTHFAAPAQKPPAPASKP